MKQSLIHVTTDTDPHKSYLQDIHRATPHTVTDPHKPHLWEVSAIHCATPHTMTQTQLHTQWQTGTNLTSEKSLRFTVQLQQVILWGLALPWLLFPGFLGCPLSQNGHHISISAHHINISGHHINILSTLHKHLSVSHKYPRASHKHPKYITSTFQGIT